ncbi:MAG: acylneuraminate cytidylyltransferase [Anaerolineae bacterium]|jgi:YrbI family 3-deoxy-D-manno-octulosonate 8-phosphate phosphatase|nr:acylneuraminate cytidylyltransferase [Anaerolineae bacterium]MBT7781825.1 acylneuraminate cytidylyltransferase [Anaerolineae bacterium]
MTEILAIIPARGGSKGIPRKNIRNFAGYPLIAYSIAAGLKSELVTRVIVSTDDDEIAEVSREFGAETPYIRPSVFAEDNTTDLPVFEHALKWLAENENYHPDMVVQLRPTSPIRPVGCVDDAIRILLDNPEVDSVRGVVPAGQNPHKMWRLPDGENAAMQNLLDVDGIAEPFNAPRQSLPPIYWQTGHIDAIRSRVIVAQKSMTGKNIFPLMIDPDYTVDIDNLSDWARYEWLVKFSDLDFVSPRDARRFMPDTVSALFLDFDGVLTDNRVWTDEAGKETVVASRGDGFGIAMLKKAGIEVIVISKERNPVVAARCKKMNVPYVQSVDDKEGILKREQTKRKLDPLETIFVGNDLNDLPAFPLVGWGVAVSDAMPEVLAQADFVLSKKGGHGAVRELCDLILSRI